uniref:Hexosyltransferase n=1 Tax=Pyramimonas obovata TaxID=1411642 RepID=A0A7S0RI02_9CHLO|mmetsp:Transcript_34830/g.76145  ORF Transcript_34830/g.76145 Transcript_34830/m.76145 type:complete len:335 (+) Transcript_34830:645-1649(+)|eukprot:CAMPEP_0118929502 /NCGR_PEP_ID=MMETSP1169-20130426/6488_1 /TAXON_ID=36882 /ORGANISM="Pyramimonas obovata, Strain CCMP722" /LENGTH=334 /DNA_ID=CAMNT_0006871707 /DNA_START=353 /DNA_END=1357 /DNA_ORIENTATION=+
MKLSLLLCFAYIAPISQSISHFPPQQDLVVVTFAYIAPNLQASSSGYTTGKSLKDLLCRYLASVIVNEGNVTLLGYDDYTPPPECRHCSEARKRKWKVYNVMSAGHGKLLETYASKLPAYTIVVVTDVFDVVFTGNVPNLALLLREWLNQRPGTVVWAFGRGCYPVPGWKKGNCDLTSPAYGLNAGFYAGFAKDIVLLSRKFQRENARILRLKVPPTGGDQGVWIRIGEQNMKPLHYRMDERQEIVRFPFTLDNKVLPTSQFISNRFPQPIAHCSGPDKYPCTELYESRYVNMTKQQVSSIFSSVVMTRVGSRATPLRELCPSTSIFHSLLPGG